MLNLIVNVFLFLSKIISSLWGAITRTRRSNFENWDIAYYSVLVVYLAKAVYVLKNDIAEDIFFSSGCPYSMTFSKWRMCSGIQIDQTKRTLHNFVGNRNINSSYIIGLSKGLEYKILSSIFAHSDLIVFSVVFILMQWTRGRKAISPMVPIMAEILIMTFYSASIFFEYDPLTQKMSSFAKLSLIRVLTHFILCSASIMLHRTPAPSEDELILNISSKIRTIEGICTSRH